MKQLVLVDGNAMRDAVSNNLRKSTFNFPHETSRSLPGGDKNLVKSKTFSGAFLWCFSQANHFWCWKHNRPEFHDTFIRFLCTKMAKCWKRASNKLSFSLQEREISCLQNEENDSCVKKEFFSQKNCVCSQWDTPFWMDSHLQSHPRVPGGNMRMPSDKYRAK